MKKKKGYIKVTESYFGGSNAPTAPSSNSPDYNIEAKTVTVIL